jgi:hypothetical protein
LGDESVRVKAESAGKATGGSSAKFFPKGWVRGYTEFGIAPPHNEPDLDRCEASAGTAGGRSAPCTAFARFVGQGYIELQPVNVGPLRRVFLFSEPRLYLGRNLPQVLYTYSAQPMALDRSLGIGWSLAKNLELRMEQHRVQWMGRYERYLGTADLGKTGPLGLYATVSARWYFGGYRDRR